MKLDIQKFAGDSGSGTITFAASGYLQGRIQWSYSKISNTTVRVTCTLQAHRTNSSTTSGKSWTGNVTIDGHSHSFGGFSSSTSISSSYVTFSTYSDDLEYSGTKTITISGWVKGPSGTSLASNTSSGSDSVELATLQLPIVFNGASGVVAVKFNGQDVTHLYINGTQVF